MREIFTSLHRLTPLQQTSLNEIAADIANQPNPLRALASYENLSADEQTYLAEVLHHSYKCMTAAELTAITTRR